MATYRTRKVQFNIRNGLAWINEWIKLDFSMTVVWIEPHPNLKKQNSLLNIIESKSAKIYLMRKVFICFRQSFRTCSLKSPLICAATCRFCSNIYIYAQSKNMTWVTVLWVDFCFSGMFTDQNYIWAVLNDYYTIYIYLTSKIVYLQKLFSEQSVFMIRVSWWMQAT